MVAKDQNWIAEKAELKRQAQLAEQTEQELAKKSQVFQKTIQKLVSRPAPTAATSAYAHCKHNLSSETISGFCCMINAPVSDGHVIVDWHMQPAMFDNLSILDICCFFLHVVMTCNKAPHVIMRLPERHVGAFCSKATSISSLMQSIKIWSSKQLHCISHAMKQT